MSMNREQRRYLKRQGQMDDDGNILAARPTRDDSAPVERDSVKDYLKGAVAELKKVTWPTRSETINYTIVVTITLLVVTAFVWGLDLAFSQGVDALLELGGEL